MTRTHTQIIAELRSIENDINHHISNAIDTQEDRVLYVDLQAMRALTLAITSLQHSADILTGEEDQ